MPCFLSDSLNTQTNTKQTKSKQAKGKQTKQKREEEIASSYLILGIALLSLDCECIHNSHLQRTRRFLSEGVEA